MVLKIKESKEISVLVNIIFHYTISFSTNSTIFIKFNYSTMFTSLSICGIMSEGK